MYLNKFMLKMQKNQDAPYSSETGSLPLAGISPIKIFADARTECSVGPYSATTVLTCG